MRPLSVLIVLVTLGLSACGASRPAAPAGVETVRRPVVEAPVRTAGDLVRTAQARHGAGWYRTLTFVQTTTFYGEQGTRSETWHEAASLPGMLRIDLPAPGEGNVALDRGDSTYVFREGSRVVARDGGNPLMLLGFDLYWLETAQTLAGMAEMGIDTTVVSQGTHAGRPAWIVGAAPGDTISAQVWYDRERLVFLRLIEHDGDETTDIRFENYEPLSGGWIAPRVEIYTDGRLVMTEDYHDMRAGVALPAGTFSPVSGPSVRWWE
jgi:hypothetical protein